MSTVHNDAHANLLWRGDVLTRVSEERLKEYRILDFLGKGSYGEVFSAECNQMNTYMAVKVFDVDRQAKRSSKNERKIGIVKKKITQELAIHSKLSHPGIVKTLDYFHNGLDRYYLVMELCQSKTLLDIIKEEHSVNGKFPEDRASKYTNQLCEAIKFLAGKKIFHRDIKPGNCLVDYTGQIKLADFGLACHYSDAAPNSLNGTPNYLSPEVIANGAHLPASEIWAIGCTIYCMLVKFPPFTSDTVDGTYRRIRKGQYRYPNESTISAQAQEVINDCLQPQPEHRIGINAIQQYKWLQMTLHMSYPLMRNNISTDPYRVPSNDVKRIDTISPSPSTDSGFSYEHELENEAYKNHNTLLNQVAKYEEALTRVKNGQLLLYHASYPPLVVAKWAEYGLGVACELTDGSVTVRYDDGVCINWPDNSMFAIRTWSPFAKPELMSLTERVSEDDQIRFSRLRGMRNYMKSLNSTSFPTDRSPKPVERIPYLVHHHRVGGRMFLLFNNGTVQIQLTSGVKVVLWKEYTDRYVGIAFIWRDRPPAAYRCAPIGCTECFLKNESRVPLYHSDKMRESVEETFNCVTEELADFTKQPY